VQRSEKNGTAKTNGIVLFGTLNIRALTLQRTMVRYIMPLSAHNIKMRLVGVGLLRKLKFTGRSRPHNGLVTIIRTRRNPRQQKVSDDQERRDQNEETIMVTNRVDIEAGGRPLRCY